MAVMQFLEEETAHAKAHGGRAWCLPETICGQEHRVGGG